MRKRDIRPLMLHQKELPSYNWKESDSPEKQREQLEYFRQFLEQLPEKRKATLEQLEAEYERTENPLCVWNAWQFARSVHMKTPDWVLKYLDGTADLLMRSNNKTSDIPTLLGFSSSSRRVNRFKEFLNIRCRDFAVSHLKKLLLNAPQSRTSFADTATAVFRNFGVKVSEATIQSWYYAEK
jgi:hypothetical protein